MKVTKSSFRLTNEEAYAAGLPMNVPRSHAITVSFLLANKLDQLKREFRQVCSVVPIDDLPEIARHHKEQTMLLVGLAKKIAKANPECDLMGEFTAIFKNAEATVLQTTDDIKQKQAAARPRSETEFADPENNEIKLPNAIAPANEAMPELVI